MFKDIKRLNKMLSMLKLQEGVIPSYSEFVQALNNNPRFIWMFDMNDEFFVKGAISELALAIRTIRGYW